MDSKALLNKAIALIGLNELASRIENASFLSRLFGVQRERRAHGSAVAFLSRLFGVQHVMPPF